MNLIYYNIIVIIMLRWILQFFLFFFKSPFTNSTRLWHIIIVSRLLWSEFYFWYLLFSIAFLNLHENQDKQTNKQKKEQLLD